MIITRGPRSQRPGDLARAGIECVDDYRQIFRCLQCFYTWGVSIRSGGGFYRGWWKCPRRCNEPR